jgi:glutamine synthetase
LVLYNSSKNIELFKRQGVYSEAEVNARQTILLEEYCKTIKIESLTMLDILNREILPTAINFEKHLAKTCLVKKNLKIDSSSELNLLKNISTLIKQIYRSRDELLKSLANLRNISG